jgi:hypothetical protein
MKSVYATSRDLKARNGDVGTGPGNCRVQVLPVCWRHLLDFPRQKTRRGEGDIATGNLEEDDCQLTVPLPGPTPGPPPCLTADGDQIPLLRTLQSRGWRLQGRWCRILPWMFFST